MKAPIPPDEPERLHALRSFDILDTAPEQSYDDVTLLASEICGVPIAAVSLVDEDRQWFKSIVGLDVRETPRDMAFCAHAILGENAVLQVPDATRDPRFSDNPLVLSEPRIRFYAGTPLVTFGGEALGTLCVIDREPRELTANQLQALRVLGRQVVYQLELRKAVSDLQQTVRHLREAETELRSEQARQLELKDQLISHVSHELRSPLTAIHQFTSLLRDGIGGAINDEQRGYLDVTLNNAQQLQRMIGDLLDATRARTGKLSIDHRCISLRQVVDDAVACCAGVASERGIRLSAHVAEALPDVVGDAGRLRQVLENLVGNALKFTPEGGAVTIRAGVDPGNAEAALVSVEDTGCGLAPEEHEHVFEALYQVPGGTERSREGLGLGLPISRELVLRHGGRMWVESEPGTGSTFHFTVPLYDVGRLIDPLLTPRNRQRGSLALLRVEVAMRDSSPRRTMPGDPLGAAWRVVAACTTPSMDIVLPRIGADARRETFHVAAMADTNGARILARRIDEQLGNSAECGPEHCFWSITTTLLPIPPAGIVLDRAALVARITERLDSRPEVHPDRRAA